MEVASADNKLVFANSGLANTTERIMQLGLREKEPGVPGVVLAIENRAEMLVSGSNFTICSVGKRHVLSFQGSPGLIQLWVDVSCSREIDGMRLIAGWQQMTDIQAIEKYLSGNDLGVTVLEEITQALTRLEQATGETPRNGRLAVLLDNPAPEA